MYQNLSLLEKINKLNLDNKNLNDDYVNLRKKSLLEISNLHLEYKNNDEIILNEVLKIEIKNKEDEIVNLKEKLIEYEIFINE